MVSTCIWHVHEQSCGIHMTIYLFIYFSILLVPPRDLHRRYVARTHSNICTHTHPVLRAIKAIILKVTLTTEDIWAYISWAPTLVLEEVILIEEVLAQTEIGEGHLPTALVEHHVAQLEVSVNNVSLVQSTDDTDDVMKDE